MSTPALIKPELVVEPIAEVPQRPTLRRTELIKRPKRHTEIRTPAVAFINGSTLAEPCKIINISESGLQIKLEQVHCQKLLGKSILIAFEYEKEWTTCQATIQWLESQKRLGCLVCDKSHSWKKFVDKVWKNTTPEVTKVAA